MGVTSSVRSTTGRLLKIAAGVGLVAYGGNHPSLVGLVLMMVGIVPIVTGFAGICVLDEMTRGWRAPRLFGDRRV